MANEPIVDREFLEKLERLTLRWMKSFPGVVGGRNTSRFSGPGQEFLDHRHFHHGDDLRAVNWRAYMRLEKMFLKMFRVEPHVPVRMLLDTSASMSTGAAPKFDYARRLAAALTYVGLVRLDTVTLEPFSERLGEAVVCSGGRHRFAPAVHLLTSLSPAGGNNYEGVVRDFVARHTQKGLLIVISDFLCDTDCVKPLQILADYGHELLLVQLWADEDRNPQWDGELELLDAETGRTLELRLDRKACERYTQAFDAYCREIQNVALRSGGRYAGLSTSLPIDEAVFGPVMQARGIA